MRICITGTPGVGKTTIAKKLGQELGHKVLNEKEFSLREGIGEFDAAGKENAGGRGVKKKKKNKKRKKKSKKKKKNVVGGVVWIKKKEGVFFVFFFFFFHPPPQGFLFP